MRKNLEKRTQKPLRQRCPSRQRGKSKQEEDDKKVSKTRAETNSSTASIVGGVSRWQEEIQGKRCRLSVSPAME